MATRVVTERPHPVRVNGSRSTSPGRATLHRVGCSWSRVRPRVRPARRPGLLGPRSRPDLVQLIDGAVTAAHLNNDHDAAQTGKRTARLLLGTATRP
ncbi:hypothetical protein [Thermomonospora umbrina]|uniref:hypothetical protein n=1 Tax=Thermomonospora umbrina TaxID=111806 RepID=UPI000E23F1B4|nr:hypothetical protein [Thermomonospora umbrina]